MHPVLRWCASNIAVRRDTADNWKPDKEKSTERIDPMVATIMALGLAMSGPTESVYEERGLMVL
jgi:phage terminase large subunit-like protein